MHFEAVIEPGWRCNWRPRLSELRVALGGRNRASLDMHVQAMIERDWRSTWKWSIWREAVNLGMMLYLMYAVLGVKS